ncbi:MAG: glycerophosphodiester phosphodiesterase family protein [Erysipelotrichaceae bacterium]|nr:glycerophosphodiester phosphodiesterase family protein [Erysipelotrichaceae bacterium]
MEWLIIISIIILIIYVSFPHREGKDLTWMKGYCAHRGLHNKELYIEENSPSAFQMAIDAGLNIEMDIRITKDGHPIVFHDSDGKRMLNIDRNIEQLTLEEVQSATIGNSKDRVLTFVEFLNLVSGKVGLIIEIKATSQNERVCQCCAEILDGYTGNFSICSFRPEILHWFLKNRKHFIRGQLIESILGDRRHSTLVRLLQSFNGFAFYAKPNYLTIEFHHAHVFFWIRIFKGFLCVWTIRDKNWMEKNKHRVDAIIFENVKI